MEASGIDAAAQRTLRFVCGCRTDGIVPEASCRDVETAAEPPSKRQRVGESSIVEVRLVELIRDLDSANDDNDKHYGLFVWPSALLLSRFVAREASWLCRDKVVLELGCGTGLPSILAGLCGAGKVYLTDRADAADIQRNAEANIKRNGLETRAAFIPLAWGDMLISDELISIFRGVQVILAADCFYQSQDFEKVLATVALIFRCSGGPASCKFFFTYQLRSISRSIAPLLARWGLTAKAIDKSELVSDSSYVDDSSARDFDSVYLYEVQRQH
ncbi:Methyltransferase-like protein 23 [Phytophthora pseudosyringae]|uniref:Methyltransferase-like protein 23 n=1 Tax=Phytophthora pseudosyringae TaxID=221518 RepID=A0A8T1W4T7_9STRA|nr:Methyltransferase-like protein 23 [Phytophthora pseudosyringae]